LVSVIFSEGPLAGELREIDRELTLGRADCDVTVDDHQVSRRHVVLKPAGDVLHVEDLGSSNGTFVNGHRISAPVSAGEGDVVTIGTSELIVRAAAPPPAPTEGPPSRAWIAAGVVEVAIILVALGTLVSYAAG
jgi:pSer/pThr/pTyr-binding forkhead associated (FHA) protein